MKRLSAAAGFFLLARVLLAQTPTITSVSGAGTNRLCPGGRAFIQGTNLNGAAVTVGALQAFVLRPSPTFLDVEIPVDAPLGATTVKVGASAPFNVTIVQYAPGVLTDGLPDNLAVAFHYPSNAAVTPTAPATPNEQIYFLVNGLGPTRPVFATGTAPSDNSAVTTSPVTVNVAGKAATVVSAYLGPNNPGIYVVQFTMRADATTGNQPISVAVGGITSGTALLPVTTGPVISSITNAASNISPGLPNAQTAQGSIVVIKGVNLGPAAISIASSAFQSTNLSGTSVSITVNGTTVAGLMYYTSAQQVAFLLPSNTPTGSGAFTVTYSGQTSPPMNHGIVANNLGIFTLDSSGQGPGIVTYADYSLVSASKAANCGGPTTACGAANPGDTLILWATGLGPVNGSDAAGAGLGQPMPSVPLTLWLGGVQAPVVYQGRSGCCVGEDQIVFTVPNNVPTGCAVPLLVQIGNEVSNNTVMPVASGSRNCTPSNPAFASVNIQQAVAAGPVTFASLLLGKILNNSGPGYHDNAELQFGKILSYSPGTQPFFVSFIDDQPLGTCLVNNDLNSTGSTPNRNPPVTVGNADAGSSLTVKGPNGSVNVSTTGGKTASLSAAGTFLVPGAFTITGTGGADIGSFTAPFTIPATPTLSSPVNANNLTVTRSNGLTVNWNPNGSTGNVQLQVYSATDSTQSNGATVFCTTPASAGTFTIPPYALLTLPNPAGSVNGFQFSPLTATVPFTATGLNLGLIQTFNAGTSFGGFTLK